MILRSIIGMFETILAGFRGDTYNAPVVKHNIFYGAILANHNKEWPEFHQLPHWSKDFTVRETNF